MVSFGIDILTRNMIEIQINKIGFIITNVIYFLCLINGTD
ncbi:uncharacterized protein METZ01_LOCUS111225 [marine metagenome]|uniref:Uncharacterized protein n=1 Tax=marine metagenome TaxID=408172 RepID=A0A381X1K8_9ZZZZ